MKKVFLLSFLFIFLSAGNSFAVKQQVCEYGACADMNFYRDGNKLKCTATGVNGEFNYDYGDISLVQNTNIIGVNDIVPTDTDALVQCAGLGSMCWGDINPGVTAYLTISDFPGWFNINQAFIVYYKDTAFNFDIATTTTTSIIPTTSTTSSVVPVTTSIPVTTSTIPVSTTTTTANGGRCVAEAVLENDKESLNLLREFRDEILMQSDTGRKYIKLYYEWSPTIITLMESDHVLRDNLKQYLQSIMPAIKSELAINLKK